MARWNHPLPLQCITRNWSYPGRWNHAYDLLFVSHGNSLVCPCMCKRWGATGKLSSWGTLLLLVVQHARRTQRQIKIIAAAYKRSQQQYLPYQAASSNDLKPTSLRRRAMQASTIHSFNELDWNKDVELKTFFLSCLLFQVWCVAFCMPRIRIRRLLFSMGFRWLDKDPLVLPRRPNCLATGSSFSFFGFYVFLLPRWVCSGTIDACST